MFHLAADDVAWVPLRVGYADFVSWCLTCDLNRLYKLLSYLQAYQAQPRPACDAVYWFYPFLWTNQGKVGIVTTQVIDASEALLLRIRRSGFATA